MHCSVQVKPASVPCHTFMIFLTLNYIWPPSSTFCLTELFGPEHLKATHPFRWNLHGCDWSGNLPAKRATSSLKSRRYHVPVQKNPLKHSLKKSHTLWYNEKKKQPQKQKQQQQPKTKKLVLTLKTSTSSKTSSSVCKSSLGRTMTFWTVPRSAKTPGSFNHGHFVTALASIRFKALHFWHNSSVIRGLGKCIGQVSTRKQEMWLLFFFSLWTVVEATRKRRKAGAGVNAGVAIVHRMRTMKARGEEMKITWEIIIVRRHIFTLTTNLCPGRAPRSCRRPPPLDPRRWWWTHSPRWFWPLGGACAPGKPRWTWWGGFSWSWSPRLGNPWWTSCLGWTCRRDTGENKKTWI